MITAWNGSWHEFLRTAASRRYPMVYLPPAARFESYPNFLYDPRQSAAIPSRYSAKEHSPEAVGRAASGGAVCVKAHYETGIDAPSKGAPVPTLELMREVRDASHRPNLPLLLHAQMRAGIAYMPTLRVMQGVNDLFDPAFLGEPRLSRVLPADLIAWYRTEQGQWFKNDVARDFGGQSDERARAILANASERRKRGTSYVAVQTGRIVFGSDTPAMPAYTNPPGYNGYLELQEMEAVGMSHRDILAAATLESARLFGIEKDYGTIEPGKFANLLLLRENPLASTAAFDTIEIVMVKGRAIPRETLAAKRE